jgi:hypothetical protein|tara:strand:- start:1214 stop:2923 length:1710 start_codon:yes stop_codon:yes gene_type:complete
MKERDIKNYFGYIAKEAEDGFTGVRKDWNENMLFYMDEYEFDNKLSWQTKIKDPIVDNLIVRMTNFFVRILMSSDNKYFTIEHPDPSVKAGLSKLVESVLKMNKFPLVFGDALKMALLTSPYITKISYNYKNESYPTFDASTGAYGTSDSITGKTEIHNVDPLNMRLDPNGNQYIIEYKEVDMVDFMNMSQVNGWKNGDKVIRGMRKQDTEGDASYRPSVKLAYVFSKCLSDENGKILDENVHFIIANKEHVVYYGKNILPKGEFPYIVGFPMKVLKGRYGRGYITKLRSLLSSYVESMNLLLDAFTLNTLGVYEVVTNNIETGKAHLFGSVVPGRLYPVTSTGTINQVYNNSVNPNATNLLFTLDRLIQNRSFQNEFFQGQPTSKGRPTASEISSKTQETTGFFADIANEIERAIIEPTLQLLLHTELIYMNDESHFDYSKSLEDAETLDVLKVMTFNERINAIKDSTLTVKGISGKVLKMTNFQKLMQIINVIGNMPQVAQALDPVKFVERIFESFDENPSDIINMDLLKNQGGPSATEPGQQGAAPAQPEQPTNIEEVLNNVRRNQ